MNAWDEWFEQRKHQLSWPPRLREMIALYGQLDGKNCKKCVHLKRYKQGACWMKCELSKITGGAGTDWKAGWPACGQYKVEDIDGIAR